MPTQPNFSNRSLYHADNLDVLRGMNSESVHLIATDPPFNKSKDFHATPDSIARGARFQDRWRWIEDVHDDWLTEIVRDFPEVYSVISTTRETYGSDMAAFLAFLGIRLIEMRRVLRDDGSIYLHCDHTAHAYLKLLMDAIFGKQSFRNEIVWAYTGPGSPNMRQFSRKHDTVLYYSKGDTWTFNADDVRIPHKTLNTNRAGRVIADAMTPEVRDAYLKKGKVPESWWPNFSPVGRIKRERTGYPTQKPLALYERIIKASSNPGDIVLDPFAGCATTPIAAERLGRQWVGIDIWEGAYQTVLHRLQSEGLAVKDAAAEAEAEQANLLTFGDVHYLTAPPKRTDYEDPIPYFQTPTTQTRKRYPPPREQHQRLLDDIGAYCQGCGANYAFDPRVLEVDHIRPKADGGSDAYDNLTLLCPPCNKVKRDRMTLTGLQQDNRKEGYLKPENEPNLRHGNPNRRRTGGRRRAATRRRR